jgi:hypothetical protein
MVLNSDNTGAMDMAIDPKFHSCTKHVIILFAKPLQMKIFNGSISQALRILQTYSPNHLHKVEYSYVIGPSI